MQRYLPIYHITYNMFFMVLNFICGNFRNIFNMTGSAFSVDSCHKVNIILILPAIKFMFGSVSACQYRYGFVRFVGQFSRSRLYQVSEKQSWPLSVAFGCRLYSRPLIPARTFAFYGHLSREIFISSLSLT